MTAGRPKLAFAEAFATGATVNHPERYQSSVDLTLHPLGPPSPEIVEAGLIDQWMVHVKTISWLTEADRRLVELACLYRANFWQLAAYRSPIVDDDKQGLRIPTRSPGDRDWTYAVDHKAVAIELRILEKLGCTPTSRPKVTPPSGKSSGRRKDWW